jgi:hypothetical protein
MKDPNQAKDVQAISILVQYLAQKVSFLPFYFNTFFVFLENRCKLSFVPT